MPGTLYAPLAEAGAEERHVAIELRGRASFEPDGTLFVYNTRLTTPDAEKVAAHQQIRLQVASYDPSPDLRDGQLVFDGTSCVYRTARGTRFPQNGWLTFLRGGGCAPLAGTPTGRIALRLRFTAPTHAAILTYSRQAAGVPANALVLSTFGLEPSPAVPIASGTLVDVYPETRVRRLTLLAYVWELRSSSVWILGVLAVAGLAIWMAVMLGSRSRAAAAFAAALALSGTYAVLMPPFQAADEPSHFLAFVAAVGRPELAAETANWAKRMQFEEIRFHSERRFSHLDRGQQGKEWTGVSAPDDARGAGVRALWGLVAPAMRTGTAPELLMFMRILHALIFAGSVCLFVLLVSRFTDARSPELLSLPLFLVPTLPFFGMHMSNYAPLLSVYVVLAAGVAIASWDGARSHVAGPILGATLGIAIAFSRSAVPLVLFVLFLLLARVLLGDRDGRSRPAWIYWVGFTSMLVGGLAMARQSYVGGLETGGAQIATSTAWLAYVLRRPWWLAVPAAAALGSELVLDRLRRRWTTGRAEALQTTVRRVALGAAAALFVLFAASLWLSYPTLYSLNPLQPASAREYVQRAVLACVTFLRFGRPDNLTSITFWGGFGWLDTLVPNLLISLLAASSGIALVLLLVWIGRTGSGRVLVWVGCAAAGFVVSAAAYALSIVRATPADLHGRYLLGLYVAFLVVAWSALARMDKSGWIRRPNLVLGVAGVACLAVHTYCLTFILARYF